MSSSSTGSPTSCRWPTWTRRRPTSSPSGPASTRAGCRLRTRTCGLDPGGSRPGVRRTSWTTARSCGTAAGSRPDDAGLVGQDHRLHPVAYAQLREHPADVDLHGPLGHVQLLRDLPVRPALRRDAGWPDHLPRTVASEWTKFRSLRSSWWTLAVSVLFTVGLASWCRPRPAATAAPAPRARRGFRPRSSGASLSRVHAIDARDATSGR